MRAVFSSLIAQSSKENADIVSMLKLSFVQNLYGVEMIELVSQITHNMYQVTYLFSLVVAGRGDVLAAGNPSKERDTWKGKCKDIEKNTSLYKRIWLSCRRRPSFSTLCKRI